MTKEQEKTLIEINDIFARQRDRIEVRRAVELTENVNAWKDALGAWLKKCRGAKTQAGLLFLICLSAFASDPILPNPALTPGDLMPGATIEQICTKGYANTFNGGVRNVPESLKKKVFIQYFGAVPSHPGDYEIDHLVSLCIGGSNSISNLWPQSYLTQPWNSHVKDRLENTLAANVRRTLKTAGHAKAVALLSQYQRDVAANWTNAYAKYISPTVLPPKHPKEVPMTKKKGEP